jgi:hypothetical protein
MYIFCACLYDGLLDPVSFRPDLVRRLICSHVGDRRGIEGSDFPTANHHRLLRTVVFFSGWVVQCVFGTPNWPICIETSKFSMLQVVSFHRNMETSPFQMGSAPLQLSFYRICVVGLKSIVRFDPKAILHLPQPRIREKISSTTSTK